jgi:hypothetical protein
MDIQFEVQKIHSQFGTTEIANYQIQKLFDKLILEDRAEQLRKHAVVGRSELLVCDWCKSEVDGSICLCKNCRSGMDGR